MVPCLLPNQSNSGLKPIKSKLLHYNTTPRFPHYFTFCDTKKLYRQLQHLNQFNNLKELFTQYRQVHEKIFYLAAKFC